MTLMLLTALLFARAGDAPCERVSSYVAAFNERDLDTMGAMVTDDIAWFAVDGEDVTVQSRGREAVLTGMEGYFAALPSAKSTVTACHGTATQAVVVETASWESKGEVRSASAPAIYDFDGELIRAVHYFPSR